MQEPERFMGLPSAHSAPSLSRDFSPACFEAKPSPHNEIAGDRTLCDARRRKLSISAGDASQMPPVPPRPRLLRSTWLPPRLAAKLPARAGGSLDPPPLPWWPASDARSEWLALRLPGALSDVMLSGALTNELASSTLPLRLCIEPSPRNVLPPPGCSCPGGDNALMLLLVAPPPPPRLFRLVEDRLRREPIAVTSGAGSRGLCCALSAWRMPPIVP